MKYILTALSLLLLVVSLVVQDRTTERVLAGVAALVMLAAIFVGRRK